MSLSAAQARHAGYGTSETRTPTACRADCIVALERIEEEEIGRGPERGRDGALRARGEDDFEDFVLGGEFVEECAAGVDVSGLDEGELAQRVVDDFAGGGHRRGEAVGAELQHGINFVEVPGDAGGHGDGALEALRCGCESDADCGRDVATASALTLGRRADKGIEDQHHAALVFAREFADHQAAGLRGDFPIDEAGAVGGQIVAQRMQLVAASAEVAGHFAAQQRQHFVELVGGLDARVDDDFAFRNPPGAFFRRSRTGSGCGCRRRPGGRRRAAETQLHFLARGAERGMYGKKTGRVRICAAPFFASPTTRSENDGHNCFSLRSSSSASTGCSAKMCSGRSNFSSMPVSTARERTPEIRMPARQQARIMKSRLLPVLTAARIENEDGAEIDDAVAREAVVDLIGDPAQAGAPRERGHDGDADPAGHAQREQRW